MEQTYEISLEDSFKIYSENEKFRDVVSKGGFVYCENRFVINNEKYVMRKDGKTLMTDYARRNEIECCLIFDLVEVLKQTKELD